MPGKRKLEDKLVYFIVLKTVERKDNSVSKILIIKSAIQNMHVRRQGNMFLVF